MFTGTQPGNLPDADFRDEISLMPIEFHKLDSEGNDPEKIKELSSENLSWLKVNYPVWMK